MTSCQCLIDNRMRLIPFLFYDIPPIPLKLMTGEIHAWLAVLARPVTNISRFNEMLSPDEQMRAKRFLSPRDRMRFVARRGILRTILASYLSVEPARLQFRYGNHGKPEIADTGGAAAIYFNISHSDGVVLLAFARDGEIGADIECVREISEMEQIANRIFASKEKEIFRSMPRSQREEAFFSAWTRKEAISKALGDGLSRPLSRFSVSLIPGERSKLLSIDGDTLEASKWSIQCLTPTPNYAGALAWRSGVSEIHDRRLASNTNLCRLTAGLLGGESNVRYCMYP